MDRITKQFVFNGTAENLVGDIEKFCFQYNDREWLALGEYEFLILTIVKVNRTKQGGAISEIIVTMNRRSKGVVDILQGEAIWFTPGITVNGVTPVTVDASPIFESIVDAFLARYKNVIISSAGGMTEPEQWVEMLERAGIARGSNEWWEQIEKLVREYRRKHGKRSLPIKGRLENVVGYERTYIYQNTNLGEEETGGNTRQH